MSAENASAQVPQVIHYQGAVIMAGTNDHGVGQFKFALVEANGVRTLWSNDSTSIDGAEPQSAVALLVVDGGYAVALGDQAMPNMRPISPSVFSNPQVLVRIWFSDGTIPFQWLIPDEAIPSLGYATIAANVTDGFRCQFLNEGALYHPIRDAWQSMATETTAGARRLHTAVWTGQDMIVWGGLSTQNRAARYDPVTDAWVMGTSNGAPALRRFHQAVWTGTEMLVFGGRDARSIASNDLLRYRLSSELYLYAN